MKKVPLDTVVNKFYDPVLFPETFGKGVKLSDAQKQLKRRLKKLSPAEKIAYLQQLIRTEKLNKEWQEIMEHPDSVEEFKNGPATIKIYRKGEKTLVIGDCEECHQSPCKHTGANFTDTGLLSGIFPKEV